MYEGRGWKNKPEDVPEEPELKGKEALVVAYIGREEGKYVLALLYSLWVHGEFVKNDYFF